MYIFRLNWNQKHNKMHLWIIKKLLTITANIYALFHRNKKNDRENKRKEKIYIFRNNSKLFYKINFQKQTLNTPRPWFFWRSYLWCKKLINIHNNANKRICSAEISRQGTTSITSIFLLLQWMFFNICLKKDVHNSSFITKNIIHQSNFNDGPFNFDRSFMYAT